MADYKVGTIVNTHGIRGEVRVISNTDFPEERFKKGTKLIIDGKTPVEVEVQTMRPHKQFILLSFKDMQNINLVEKYKTHDLLVPGDDQQELEADDEFYYHEIIGLTVVDEDTDEVLGEVKEILDMPVNDVWVVKRQGAADMYLPYIASVVKDVQVADGKVYVHQLQEF